MPPDFTIPAFTNDSPSCKVLMANTCKLLAAVVVGNPVFLTLPHDGDVAVVNDRTGVSLHERNNRVNDSR